MRTPRIIAAFLFLYAVLAVQASAQVNTASLTGQVTDTAGAAVANASVTVKNKATAAERSTNTDSSGYYTFASLPVGVYSVTVESQGFNVPSMRPSIWKLVKKRGWTHSWKSALLASL
jgi:hypothetical protein